jgi:hypothetical protein
MALFFSLDIAYSVPFSASRYLYLSIVCFLFKSDHTSGKDIAPPLAIVMVFKNPTANQSGIGIATQQVLALGSYSLEKSSSIIFQNPFL